MRKLVVLALRAFVIALFTAILLEIVLQLAFPYLPKVIIEHMPQYQERIGYDLETEHGARQLPALQAVDYFITPPTGDLYSYPGACVSQADIQPFEPYGVSFKRDSRGFRNQEPWPDDVDLVVLGDSFTAAEIIQRPYWQGIAESMLVLALPGSGTVEQQLLFDYYALPRKPKTTVLAYFSGNDLADNGYIPWMKSIGLTWRDLPHLYKHAHDYSMVFRLAQYLADSLRKASQRTCHYPLVARTEPPTPVIFYRYFLPQLRLNEEHILETHLMQHTKTSISEIAAAMKAAGGELVFMYIPTKIEIYWDYLDDESKDKFIATESRDYAVGGLKYLEPNLHVQRRVMREFAEEIGIAFLDLTPALRAAVQAGTAPYFVADTHWNQQGHDIARNALLGFLNATTLESSS
ncbi:MAG: hypothetical protein OXE95_11115 [Chloroflexi bacterium]|nr:hypothetical protein [Chloroflexota bacterium]MCY4248108.1 hypothetical protein [Chloroflexota bacterium]